MSSWHGMSRNVDLALAARQGASLGDAENTERMSRKKEAQRQDTVGHASSPVWIHTYTGRAGV